MWNTVVAAGNTIASRMIVGALNVLTAHPVLTFSFLALMLALACTICVDVSGLRLDAVRRQTETARGKRIRPYRT